ncbi:MULTISPECIES: alpha/beta fold hydrolase [unclassified Massilia]|uniref:alpha/beta fold hydrolase n=1 Tax=unclassified Massilia TaxID=2609279 RepID=UPI00068977F3|nr:MULTISPECIES: alpha/beta hydrolase [unclassified Massilia]AWG45888.1 hypothetical protein AM586_21865 [Massilia sp. WG5]
MTAHARVLGPNTVATANGVQLFYRDWPGSHPQARPVLFVAGWSMASGSWGYQMMALQRRGLRCIAFDRRGHGRSSDPGGYDFDTLVGHSMGCNEIVRCLTRFGSAGRVERIALLEQFRSRQLLRDYPLWIEENIEPALGFPPLPGANATTKACWRRWSSTNRCRPCTTAMPRSRAPTWPASCAPSGCRC